MLARKTVLFVDHTAKLGGGEIALLHLVTALDSHRFRSVVLLAEEGPLAAKLRAAQIETHILPLDVALRETRKDSLGLASLFQLRQAGAVLAYSIRLARWARAFGVDLIHTNSLKSDLYGALAGRMAGIPVIWYVRDHINARYLPASVAMLFRLASHVLPQKVIVNSASTLHQLRPRNPGSAEVVHDGCHVPDKPLTSESQTPVIALIGRIAEWKGQHIFLQAAAIVRTQFPEAKFWIIGAPLFGEFDYQASLHTLTEELQLTVTVDFLGFRDNVSALMPQITIVVHTSIWGEPFGQVVIEGMAAGKPLVATDGGALPEIVVPGETGCLVPMGDPEAMAEALIRLLSDPAGASAMGVAGRQRVTQFFTIGHTARKIEAVYDQLFARNQV